MKSLCVINKYWPSVGGSQMHTREIMQRLSQTMDVHVGCFNSGLDENNEIAVAHNKAQQFFDKNVKTTHFTPPILLRWGLTRLAPLYATNTLAKIGYTLLVMLYAYLSLKPLIKHTHVVHIIYNGMTPIAEVAMWLAKKYNKRVIITPLLSFGTELSKAHPGARLLNVITKADQVIALTKLEKNYLISLGVEQHNIAIVPVGAMLADNTEADTFSSQLADPSAPFVLFLSRLVQGKGYHLVAKAMALVWQQHPTTQFVFLGPKDDQALEFLSQYCNDPRVTLITNDCQQLKSDALAACSMLCVPTYSEGLGGVFIEAWHYQKPVIAGDIAVLQSVIDNHIDGLLVPHTEEAIAMAINRLLADPYRANVIGKQGFKKATHLYNWRTIANKIHAIYSNNSQLFKI